MTDTIRLPNASAPVPASRAVLSLSNRLAASMSRRGLFYGWAVAGATFLVMLANAGAMGAAGVFIVPLQKEFGWSAADISSAFAIRLALFGLTAPFAAAFINRFGIRPVVVTAIGMVSAGLLASLAMTQLWQLVALWGVLIGFGTGMVALVLGATVAARWFHHRRGLVVGMLTASTATGQLVFLPLLAKLTEDHGWRAALGFVVVMLLLAGVVALLVLRDRPSDVGLAPYGARAPDPPPPQTLAFGPMLASPLRALAEARASRTFWVLFVTFFVCGLSTNGLIQTHWIALCGDYGVAPVAAAGALAAIGVFDFVGTILSGWLSDRYDNRWLLFVYYGLRGLSLIVLPFTDFSVVWLSAFAVFYGLDWVATVPPTVRLTVQRFGAERSNLTFGWIFAAHQLGAATAAFGAGAFRTELMTYLPALYAAGAACLVAAALALTIGRPRPALAAAAAAAE
ncbi:MFS transporter [Roseiarcus fermentans]|uniref:MFS transporter n=2 Tax=Roseiarcus fermentans TaxID=1473586 RepID=A0A366F4P2_9HYPH|nr:MFS transporter [Roseiarcus fermentans]